MNISRRRKGKNNCKKLAAKWLRSFMLDFVPFKNLRYLGIGGLSEYESISKSSQSCYKNSLDRTLVPSA